ncbi:hypothetical protein L596_021664 [Steinernema carpocapsae]|uniref:Uncharacterized protein n=1 Tax=Steinernema carpocapsae TaxID=34508 RepID=A0A4U5MJF4_STECR|nr:hypothetical protein L596_021664 [Steinernema carpocapsae]
MSTKHDLSVEKNMMRRFSMQNYGRRVSWDNRSPGQRGIQNQASPDELFEMHQKLSDHTTPARHARLIHYLKPVIWGRSRGERPVGFTSFVSETGRSFATSELKMTAPSGQRAGELKLLISKV